MARSAGPPHPVGLARRSRRVLAAAVIAAAALVLSTAISGAWGDKPGPPDPAKVAKQQAELDKKIEHVQDEAAHRVAKIDDKAQHLQEEAAKKQAEIDRRAQHVLDEAAKKQAYLDRKAAKYGLASTGTAPAAAPQQQAQSQPQTTPRVVTTQATTTPAPVAQTTPSAPASRHVVHEATKLADRQAGLERHVTHEQAEIAEQRSNLARHIAKKQAKLDRQRAGVTSWLAERLAALLRQRLGLDDDEQGDDDDGNTRIPPAEWQPAPSQNFAASTSPGVAVPPAPQPPATATPPAGTPAPPPVIEPDGEIPTGTGQVSTPERAATPTPAAGTVAPASEPQGAVVTAPEADKGGGGKRRGSGSGGSEGQAPAAGDDHRAPSAVVLHPLVRAVTEIPRTVWVGMSGLGALALALALVSVLQSRRAVKLAAAQRALRADMATLSSAVMPAVPTMLGGLALSVASRPASGPASGGDFHDAFELTDGRSAVVVGDVAGKGREAVAATVLVRHTLRAYLEAGLEPRAALATAGAVLADRHEGLLATAVVAVHDRYRETLTLASAGHVPPIVLGGAGHRPVEVAWPPPLGAGVPTGRRQTTMPLPPGTTVCLFTDGASEARLGDGRVGSGELANWLRELGPEATAAEMLAYVHKRADQVDDDVTICVLRTTDDDGAAPAELVEELAVSPGEGPTLIRFLIACGVSPSRAAELAVGLEQAPQSATLVAEVHIGERSSQARLRPAQSGVAALA